MGIPNIGKGCRLVFKSPGMCVGIAGLDEDHHRRLVHRWCCEIKSLDTTQPNLKIGILGTEGFKSGERKQPLASTRKRCQRERFGVWQSSMCPGEPFDSVDAVTPATVDSSDFQQAVDLCVTHLLALQGGVVIHGSAFEWLGRSVLVVGNSGSGKTTLAAAALRAGGSIVSDDLLLAAVLSSGVVQTTTLRREMLLRAAGHSLLDSVVGEHLEEFDDGEETRWQLSPDTIPKLFKLKTLPQALWLVSVDRRLNKSRISSVDQGTALAWLIRGTTALFLKAPFEDERRAVLRVLVTLAERCSALRIRLGWDLLSNPETVLEIFLGESSSSKA